MRVGSLVITLDTKKKSNDWLYDGVRLYGKKAKIVKESNGHGLCFLVKYDDSELQGWFDDWELFEIKDND